jgi:hypothetical protein
VTAKVCLRCDWTGEADGSACPRCGTTLYGAPRSDAPGEPAPARPPEQRPRRRLTAASAGVVAVLALAIAAFVFVQAHTGSATGEAGVAGRDGYLLVPTRAIGGGARLWVWDIAAGTASPGPVLARVPEQLVESVSLQDTWIGITTATASGGRTAAVVRALGPTVRPIVVARGRFVAWSAEAGYVSVAGFRQAGGCAYDLTVRTWFVTIRHGGRRFSGRVCGEPVAFARDRLVPYVALRDANRLRVAEVGNGVLRTIGRGMMVLSASSEGDLLVQAPGGPLDLWSPPSPPVTVARGFVPERVLAWSTDADHAYVLGSLDGVHGVYRLNVGADPRLSAVETTSATTVAATTAIDDVYIVADGVVRRWHDGALVDVPLPNGMPAPEGPLLWISALPYSSPEG